MTSIFNINQGLFPPPQLQARKNQNPQAENQFADALRAQTASGRAQAAAKSVLREIEPLPFSKAPPPAALWHDISGLIDSLEAYALKLENPRNSLKQLDPIIADIRDRAREILQTAEGLGDADNLHKIAAECAVTAEMEYIRFKRGDYL